MNADLLAATDTFPRRHLGPSSDDVSQMLQALGYDSLDALARATVPERIALTAALDLGPAVTEHELIAALRTLAGENQVFRSFIGMGYHDTITPPVILRNVLENPGWYTQYTPYQAEISQGRLEALVNFQTMVSDLTGLPLANASLLDEATAAAEAMNMCVEHESKKRPVFWAHAATHPQTLAVMATRAEPLAIELRTGSLAEITAAVTGASGAAIAGVLLSYPATDGQVGDLRDLIGAVHVAGGKVVMATDLLALTLLAPPGELGADIAVGSTQRFGVPMGFGGPHAAFLTCRDDFRRNLPGRIIGVSRDAKGKTAYRLALQTREQHIRREKATSNICTAQVLLAVMASMYAVYHGPDGLRRIAQRVRAMTATAAAGLTKLGVPPRAGTWFDTLRVDLAPGAIERTIARAEDRGLNLRVFADGVGVACDETTTLDDLQLLLEAFAGDSLRDDGADDVSLPFTMAALVAEAALPSLPVTLVRSSAFLTHPTFHRYHAEHEMLRYIHRLQAKDLSLTTSMIPLGSCTMKLNATTEMIPVTWPEFGGLHPFAPASQTGGYQAMFRQLEAWLATITGFAAVSLQPNSGAQGEYAGLLAIRGFHRARGQGERTVCLIPASAHGTNPASAVLAGFQVVPVASAADGTIDLADLRAKATLHAARLGALMVTYPSTHGVFEEGIVDICAIVHEHGGQVYMDGANMNAQVGLTSPGHIGADVCHLNLHKTFCIPHGGGGPGMGPIAVAAHLAPFLPGHPLVGVPGFSTVAASPVGAVSAANWGSASILPISFAYIAMMGGEGLTRATQTAILGANYIAHQLGAHYPVLFTGRDGRVAHELIIDCRGFKKTSGIEAEDIAKRLMDYGFHAPTMSFPVPGTLMIEPTESEAKGEIDRFCAAMIAIRAEIAAIEVGTMDRANNALKHAPHTAEAVTAAEWDRPYSREQAAFPAPWLRLHKYWPTVARVDNAYGDRNLVCACPPMESYG